MKITRFGKHYPSKQFQIWRDQAVNDILFHLNQIGHVLITAHCKLTVNYWSGDRKRRDVPAMLDALFHCFERAGLIQDDSLIENVIWTHRGYDKKNPRVEIEI